MSFAEWMKAVDRACAARVGLSIHDLPDVCFRDLFDSGCDPSEAVDEALEAADYPVEF